MPPELANKIAAGEVIQRPASVAKELLDNAIDAGADSIRVIIQNAGRTLIQVIDNGSGMGEEDLRPCFRQHATSKISDIDDLFRIRTLGFRGEAMASIASIAQVEVKTKRIEDDTGFLYEIHGGKEKRLEPAATDDGTSVAVRNLFYNVPARRQFLKTDATEFRHILSTFHDAALSHSDIAFHLEADGEPVYKLPPAKLEQRVVEIFGKRLRSSLIPFREDTSYVKISGLLGDPKVSKKSRGEQFVFVNGRPVQHRVLVHVIMKIYGHWMGEREYPFFAIFLELDSGQVDVNVHPAKMEVKFEDERSIIQLSKSVVKKALNEYFLVPDIEKESAEKRPPGIDVRTGNDFNAGFGELKGFRAKRDDQNRNMQIPSRINFDENERNKRGFDGKEIGRQLYGRERVFSDPRETSDDKQPVHEEERRQEGPPGRKGQGFWQLHNRYILTQTRSGLCVIDQYRAHMRIIYEKAIGATEESLPGTQQLLFAQTIEFSASDFSLLKELLPIIQRMGFSVQLLSGHSAIINGVPADIDIGNEQSVLREMLQQYRDLDRKLKLDARRKVAIAFASRTAIPRGRRLSGIEMETIIDQLFACEDPYTDPLNKPTLVYMSMEELGRRFG